MILVFKDFLGDEYDNTEIISFIISTERNDLSEEIIKREYESSIRAKAYETIERDCLEIYEHTPKFKRLCSKIKKNYTLYNFVIEKYDGNELKYEEIFI